jgi:hypothetical protein
MTLRQGITSLTCSTTLKLVKLTYVNITVMTLLNLLDTFSISVPDLGAQGQEEKVVAEMNVKQAKFMG